MAVSKVELANGEVLMDLTSDSVTPDTLAEGETAHDATGEPIVGRMKSGGGASVQSDWNQTDETAADFIKNKPFGDFPTILYEGTDLAPEYADGAYSLETPVDFSLIDGQQYTVVLDGVEYVSDALLFYGTTVIGNPMFFGGDDNGLPFLYMVDGYTGMFISLSSFSSLSVSTVEPKKIDEKYVTAEAVFLYTSLEDKYLYKNNEEIESNRLTVSELISYVVSGRKIYVYTGVYYSAPVNITLGQVGRVSVIPEQNAFELKNYYTAEYTP